MPVTIERLNPNVTSNNIPRKFPKDYLADFYYTFSKPLLNNGIIIEVILELYRNPNRKEYRFSAKADYIFNDVIPENEEKYKAFYKCFINEIDAYRKALESLKLKKYQPLNILAPYRPFEIILPAFKELYEPNSNFSGN